MTDVFAMLPHPGTCAICNEPATVYPLSIGTGTAWLCMACKLSTVLTPHTRPIHDNDTKED